jgi:hypothetical protein
MLPSHSETLNLTVKCTDYDQPLWTALIERGKPRRVREVFGTEWNRNSFVGRMQVVENMGRCYWVAMDRLHEKGYISDPKNKAKSKLTPVRHSVFTNVIVNAL